MDKAVEIKRKYTGTQLILMVMAKSPGNCVTVEELMNKTGLKRERIITYLYRLNKKGVITRHWRHFSNKKVREYCLKYKTEILGM